MRARYASVSSRGTRVHTHTRRDRALLYLRNSGVQPEWLRAPAVPERWPLVLARARASQRDERVRARNGAAQ